MVGFLIALAVVWIVLVVIGFSVKALLWLAYVGIVLIIVTAIIGGLLRYIRGRS